MKPVQFPEANIVMRKPDSMTEEECCDIHASRQEWGFITCWKPSEAERVKIALGEPIWISLCGDHMQPHAVTADNPFEETVKGDA
jgi:hypothetical protein